MAALCRAGPGRQAGDSSGRTSRRARPAPQLAQDLLLRQPPGHVQLAKQSTRRFLAVNAQGFGNFSWFFFYSLLDSTSLNFGLLIPLYNDGFLLFVFVIVVGLFLAYLRGFPKFFAIVSGQNTWYLSLNICPVHTRVPPCFSVSPVAVSRSDTMCPAAPLDRRPAWPGTPEDQVMGR